MINEHKTISLYGLPLFTWIDLNTPLEEQLQIPSSACFTYILEGDNQLIAKQPRLQASAQQVIVSLCGATLSQLITAQEPGHLNSIIVHFHPEILTIIYRNAKPPHWQEITSPVTDYLVQVAASNLVQHYIEGVKHLFQYQEAVTEDILILKLKEIVLLLMKTNNSPAIIKIIRSLFSERSFSFQEIVEAHLFVPVSVEGLANLTNTSISTFKREFKKIYDSTPVNYIMNRRVEKVAAMLKVSDDAISNIGYDCGFSSPAHLNKVFKAKYGITPSAYRLDFAMK